MGNDADSSTASLSLSGHSKSSLEGKKTQMGRRWSFSGSDLMPWSHNKAAAPRKKTSSQREASGKAKQQKGKRSKSVDAPKIAGARKKKDSSSIKKEKEPTSTKLKKTSK